MTLRTAPARSAQSSAPRTFPAGCAWLVVSERAKASHPVVSSKDPDLREPPLAGSVLGAFEPRGATRSALPADIAAEDVELLTRRLSVPAGPGGTGAVNLRSWLLHFGKESDTRRKEMARWATWLASNHPPWAARPALVATARGSAILQNNRGVPPLGAGEICRCLRAKCLSQVTGSQATAARSDRLPSGLKGAVFEEREVSARRFFDAVTHV